MSSDSNLRRILDFNESFPRGFLRISGDLSKVYIINAKGDSMEPTIANGELLFISTANAGGVISGNIYVINYGGDVFVKRLEKPDNKSRNVIFG
ncbi:S24 family peptidase [Campylobacter showae]|uniref:S24 family peptidase n=1 Tax=Campylobacter showae TaxID=204 RepID=UPI000F073CE4|nr:S24 family peptidase [Campylobacter showae]